MSKNKPVWVDLGEYEVCTWPGGDEVARVKLQLKGRGGDWKTAIRISKKKRSKMSPEVFILVATVAVVLAIFAFDYYKGA